MSRIIPTYENDNWTSTEFSNDEDFHEFIFEIFKEPGKYEFDETSLIFNAEARRFNKEGFVL